jgi:alkanesulfonate monooxygenase SsuD/methylene tetrahydromethanopterin reductase-like flavin-dependent oxidoreductase (luciferase family)
MRFSIYSELQSWPGKPYSQLYGEVLEQIENADRLGYDAYAAIEHLFFPKFSASANVFGLFGMAAARTKNIKFRTMLHILPYHNPLVLAAMIHEFSLLTNGRYEFGVGRGHGWIPSAAGLPLDETARPRYEEALDLFIEALHKDTVSFHGEYWDIDESLIVPFSGHRFRVVLGGTSDRTYDLAAKHGWAVAVPPLLPYAALKDQLDLYRAKCAEYGTTPDIIWIHACYIDDDRELARREAETHMRGFLAGNASPLTEHTPPPADKLNAAGYGFYASGIMEKLAATPYDDMIAGDIVWVGTPDDVVERIRETIDVCEGLTEIAITTNPGGVAHWKAIKAQELFAQHVIPRVREMTGDRPAQSVSAPA